MLGLILPMEEYVGPSTFKLAPNSVSLLKTVDGLKGPARNIQAAT
jgi:hypothetical protein